MNCTWLGITNANTHFLFDANTQIAVIGVIGLCTFKVWSFQFSLVKIDLLENVTHALIELIREHMVHIFAAQILIVNFY